MGHFRVPFAPAYIPASHELVCYREVHSHVNQIHFYMKGFPRGLILKQRHKVIRKLPTANFPLYRGFNNLPTTQLSVIAFRFFHRRHEHFQ